MVIRNKKIIGLISFLVGLIICGYMVFTIRVIFYGNRTDAVVTGFVVHQNGARKVLNENGSGKKPFSGRSPFVKFRIENGSEVETYSKVLQVFFFTGYHLGNKVTVVYNPKNPQEIFILNAKEIPGLLLITAFGILLIFVARSYLFSKNKDSDR
jgi:hypothetical protein